MSWFNFRSIVAKWKLKKPKYWELIWTQAKLKTETKSPASKLALADCLWADMIIVGKIRYCAVQGFQAHRVSLSLSGNCRSGNLSWIAWAVPQYLCNEMKMQDLTFLFCCIWWALSPLLLCHLCVTTYVTQVYVQCTLHVAAILTHAVTGWHSGCLKSILRGPKPDLHLCGMWPVCTRLKLRSRY